MKWLSVRRNSARQVRPSKSPPRSTPFASILCVVGLLSLTVAAQADLTTGLVAYYPFNGNANDASGNGLNPTTIDATLTSDIQGRPNSAYYFDGNSSSIVVPDNQLLKLTSALSLSAWVKTPGCNWRVGVVHKLPGIVPDKGYGLRIIDQVPEFVLSTAPGTPEWGAVVYGNAPINDDQWHLLVGTYDGATMRIYIDGQLHNSATYSLGAGITTAPLRIGYYYYPYNDGRGNPPGAFNGSIDEVRIYNRALSAQEVQQLYTQAPALCDILSEDFESYSVGSWPSPAWTQDANAINDSSNNQIVNSPGGRSGKSLKLFGQIGGCWASLGYHQFSPPSAFELEFDVYNGAETLSGCHPYRAYVGLRQGTSWTHPSRPLIQFMGDGSIWGEVSLGQYQVSRWYHVKVGYHRTGNQLVLSYWIDGQSMGSANLTIADTSQEDSLDHLDLTAEEGSVWFDNICMASLGCPGDADCDGLPDDWEVHGVDVGGVHLDLLAMGANPFHKDVFMEIDYMVQPGLLGHTHKPKAAALQKVIQAFANAPVTNPDGTTGINIHIDAGSDTVMNPVTGELWGNRSQSDALAHQDQLGPIACSYDWTAFDAIKNNHFAQARSKVFHYCIFAHNAAYTCNQQCPSGCPNSGISRGYPSSDFIVSLGTGWDGPAGSDTEQAGTLMHELGHNLGLRHGGNDDSNFKPNYLSIMNYSFQTRGLRIGSSDGHIDYSRFQLPSLDENLLDETVGLSGVPDAAGYGTRFYDPNGIERPINNINGPIDWNWDNNSTEHSVAVDINRDGVRTVLLDTDNWKELVFNGGQVGHGESVELPLVTADSELTVEEDRLILTEYGVSITGPAQVTRTPCDVSPYPITITNTGKSNDVYQIVSSKIQPWVDTSALPQNITLAAGASVTFNLPVVVGLGTPPGAMDTLLIAVTSTANPLVSDSLDTTTVAAPNQDTDGDGVCDALDQCPDTPFGAIVNATGCSIAQLVPCDGPASGGKWKSHGQYVQAVVKAATDFLKAKLITRKQWVEIVTRTAWSKCGWNRRYDHDWDKDWHRNWDCDRDRDWGRGRNWDRD